MKKATNAFTGKKEQPTENELTSALGPAKKTWDQLLSELGQEHGVTIQEWKCYSAKWGWSLRVKRGMRTILWLAPLEHRFEVLFIFGEKAMAAVQQSKLPKHVSKVVRLATKYPEGYGVRLEVKAAHELSALKKLAAIKLAN
jgi:hypothetical protein